jgi:hypothetical protein
VALVLSVLVVGSASASPRIKPPPGAPDLSQMALRVSDLSAGARVQKQGYVETSSLAEYDREFAERSVHVGGKRLLALENDVSLESSARQAAAEFAALRHLLSTKSGRTRLANALKEQVGVAADFVRVGAPYRFGAGQESVAVSIVIGTFLGKLYAVLGFLRVDRVVSIIVFIGDPDVKVGRAQLVALGRPGAAHVRAGLAPISTAAPAISGIATAGQTLTASPGAWRSPPASFSYRWQRCDASGANCVDIPGATTSTRLLLDDDVGSTVRVEVTAANAFGSSTTASVPSAVVAPLAGAPLNVVPPSISGVAAQGQTLTAVTGVWVGKPTSFAYQWQRCDTGGANCVSIDGATAPTYAVVPADAGMTLRVAVTATNASGVATVVSPATAAVT